jgi:dTDP-L-rhamnose 4-epimerase
MSVYGEGLYADRDGKPVELAERKNTVSVSWNPVDASGNPLTPIATPEWKRPNLASVYALTKYVQEQMILNVTAAYGMEGVALRLFNVYGPGQALSNPYTGVLAIFAARLANGKPPLLFEDGRQRRDFVHVDDVAEAFASALEHPKAVGEIYNVGSGQDRSIVEIAEMFAAAMNRPEIVPEITGKARTGDIRHCFADTRKIAQELGFVARQDFAEGLANLAEWVAGQQAHDRVAEAKRELEARGLVA